jgi:hypothetical protein
VPGPDNFGEQFGFTRREQNEAAGRAIGEHLWSAMEDAMGGEGAYKAAVQEHALHLMRHMPMQPTRTASGGIISMREDDDGVHAHYKHPSGWSVRWHGGPYADIYTPKGEPVDVFNFTNHNTGEVAAVQPHELAESLDEFVRDSSQDY